MEREKQEPFVVNRASSFSDWILSCALSHTDGHQLRERAMADDSIILRNSSQPWSMHVVLPPKQEPVIEETEEKQEAPVNRQPASIFTRKNRVSVSTKDADAITCKSNSIRNWQVRFLK